MIKNKLYPLVEKYINEFLYGFSKEQLQVGITNGIINLSKLNLRPDAVNAKLDDKNLPIWLKAGLISKITVGCSIMNFIGEKPLEINIEGIDILLTPSYRWIIQNVKSFLPETVDRINDDYDMTDNNSHDIFTQKVNVFDSSIFKQQFLLEIFKDGSKISNSINKIFQKLFKFYYMKNYAINCTIKNIHIRFEDDQLINFIGDIAIGIKIGKFCINLSSEGIMKRDLFKLDQLDIYWELQPKILISSELLTNSLQFVTLNDNYSEGNLKLDDDYYTKLNALNFTNFKNIENTAYIIQNFNCNAKFGTQSLNTDKVDIFSKQEKSFNLYVQFASSELNLNIFPELATIGNNFKKFFKTFTIIKEVESFKPMKKPMDFKDPVVEKMLNFLKSRKPGDKIKENFMYKKKMYVRDWLYYFFWCKKCTSSMDGKSTNPLRLEFSRFFNIVYGCIGEDPRINNSIELKKEKDKKDTTSVSVTESTMQFHKSKPTKENPNPDNVNISLNLKASIKGVNINLHSKFSDMKKSLENYIAMKISGGEIIIKLDKEQFDLTCTTKGFDIGPSKLIEGERVIINSTAKKKMPNMPQFPFGMMNPMMMTFAQQQALLKNQSIMQQKQVETEDSFSKMMKKDPAMNERMKILNSALFKSSSQSKQSTLKDESPDNSSNNNNINNRNKFNSISKTIPTIKKESNTQSNKHNNIKGMVPNKSTQQFNTSNIPILTQSNPVRPPIPGSSNYLNILTNKPFNIFSSVLSGALESSKQNKIENENKTKDASLSQKISEYNRVRSQNVSVMTMSNRVETTLRAGNSNKGNSGNTNSGRITTSTDKKIIPLNLFEINTNQTSPSFKLKFTKSNKSNLSDSVSINFGTIRLNLFSEYVSSILTIISEYKSIMNKPQKKQIKNSYASGLKVQRQLINMKKYIFTYLKNLPEEKKDSQVKDYLKYLKREIEVGDAILKNKGNFEINYLLSMFSNGLNFQFDYDNFECVYYKKTEDIVRAGTHKILGKFCIPQIDMLLKLNVSSIFVKFFDLEFEINDLENSKILMNTLLKIMEEKLKYTAIFIQPCFKELKEEFDKKFEDKENLLDDQKNHFGMKIVQNNINNLQMGGLSPLRKNSEVYENSDDSDKINMDINP